MPDEHVIVKTTLGYWLCQLFELNKIQYIIPYLVKLNDQQMEEYRKHALYSTLYDLLEGQEKISNITFYFNYGTEFQKKVWNALLEIPKGETTTYAEIAKKIGHPKAVRAVGSAVGKNPIAIIIPCHRVLPASGKLGNYAYGTDLKKKLLEREGAKFL